MDGHLFQWFGRKRASRPRPAYRHRHPRTLSNILRLARSAPAFGKRLYDHLVKCMPPRIGMVAAARSLGVSERSLRRHLAAEGSSYQEVEYKALAYLSERMLRDRRRTIQETAFEMGFSDATSFHRAFKRWTGMTPSAFVAIPAGHDQATSPPQGDCGR